MLARWRKELRPSTAKNYRHELAILLRAVAANGGPRIDLPKVPKPQQRGITATPEELARILKAPPAWLRLFILLYFQCGLRRAETLAVTPRNWNPENKTVTIPIKGGRTRTVHVSPDVEALIVSTGNPDPDTPYLWALRGRPLRYDAITKAWEKHKKACGVNPLVNAHDLRRTAATILYTATKDLRTAQELLGHKNLQSTLSYLAPLHPDDARKYSELLRFQNFHSEVKQ
ncbi:MAG: tyrosine-type recombinase/integrase [Acidobacteria bacterium]|nr:tyrosine-type recombinase/integrase [Acidobacteriota bacterium]MBS1865409.1 tyrosine-type recombinase/integrase [Acidobacteriota bacterium]